MIFTLGHLSHRSRVPLQTRIPVGLHQVLLAMRLPGVWLSDARPVPYTSSIPVTGRPGPVRYTSTRPVKDGPGPSVTLPVYGGYACIRPEPVRHICRLWVNRSSSMPTSWNHAGPMHGALYLKCVYCNSGHLFPGW